MPSNYFFCFIRGKKLKLYSSISLTFLLIYNARECDLGNLICTFLSLYTYNEIYTTFLLFCWVSRTIKISMRTEENFKFESE